MKVVLERNLGFMGYPNYSVDTEGNVWNIIRGHKRKHSTIKEGYMLVILYNNGARKSFLIHRLVAFAFIPNPNKYSFINHKNENKCDNSVGNLEWCSANYNNNYGTRNERISNSTKGSNNHKSKPIMQYTKDGEFIREWACSMDVERELGYKNSAISQCCTHKRKTAYGFIWRFKTDTPT